MARAHARHPRCWQAEGTLRTDAENVKGGPTEVGPPLEKSGGDLLSQGESTQVPSAQFGLTSVFGMGTGVTQTQ